MHSKFHQRRSFGLFLAKRYPFPQTKVSGTIVSGDNDHNGTPQEGGGIFTGPITITIKETYISEPTAIQISTSAETQSTSSSPFSETSSSAVSTTGPAATTTSSFMTTTQMSSSLTSFFTTSYATVAPSPSASVVSSNETQPISGSNAESTTLPAGAIVGIIIACMLVVAAVIIFMLRKRYVRNRMKLRGLWNGPNSVPPMGISSEKYTFPAESSPVVQPPANNFSSGGAIRAPITQPRVPVPRFTATPPPIIPAALEERPSSPGTRRGSQLAVTTKSPPSLSPFGATVKYTFYTSLSDELKISVGERVRVLAEYDDGWGLCINSRGEQGVLPLECLDRGDTSASPAVLDKRLNPKARRMSSLPPPPRSPVAESIQPYPPRI